MRHHKRKRPSNKVPNNFSDFRQNLIWSIIFVSLRNIKFKENPSSGNRVLMCGWTDGQARQANSFVFTLALRQRQKNWTNVNKSACCVCRWYFARYTSVILLKGIKWLVFFIDKKSLSVRYEMNSGGGKIYYLNEFQAFMNYVTQTNQAKDK